MKAAEIFGAKTVRSAYGEVGNHGPGFDTLRLVAATAVIFHHALAIQFDKVRDDYLFGFSGGYTHTGLLAVSVFFALSGYLVVPGLAKGGDVLEYLSRRFMRIMPLLVVVVAVTALVIGPLITALPLRAYFASAQTWHYLKNMTTSLSLQLPGVTGFNGSNSVNGSLWTLRFEWYCYLVLAAASLLGIMRNRSIMLLAWLGAVTVMLGLYGRIPEGVEKPHLYVLLSLFSYFGAGSLMYLFGDRIRVSWPLGIAAFVALMAAWHFGLGYALAPALTAYLVVCIGLVRFPWSPLLAKADLSYGVYLTHAVILTILTNIQPFTSAFALFWAGLVVTYATAWLTWTYLEKPALEHKSVPARMAKGVLGRLRKTALST